MDEETLKVHIEDIKKMNHQLAIIHEEYEKWVSNRNISFDIYLQYYRWWFQDE